ncbi:MAG: endonuclease domain-containing protein [Nevskia sp.]|nr:endonuclease domain-containing protein [Nevskia sp.]
MSLRYGTAKALRRQSTDAERKLWSRLRNRQIEDAKFRRQQPIGPYVVDFACMEHHLIVELDGGHHLEQLAEDEARTAFLKKEGYRVLRFWDNEVLAQTEGVLVAILEALAQAATPHPNPLPQGERGRKVPAEN